MREAECNGLWLQVATRLLERNEIPMASFFKAIYTTLEQGRGTYHNVFIHGPANCGKTFMLSTEIDFQHLLQSDDCMGRRLHG